MLVDIPVDRRAGRLVELRVVLLVAEDKVGNFEDILAVDMFAEDKRNNLLCFDTFLFIFLLIISSFYFVD